MQVKTIKQVKTRVNTTTVYQLTSMHYSHNRLSVMLAQTTVYLDEGGMRQLEPR